MDQSQPPFAADSAGGLQSATIVAYMLNRAATANLESPLRRGCAVYLPRRGHLLMTGDIHGDQAGNVRAAVERFIRSLILAVRCENGVFCSHSLPSVSKLDTFDISILDRVPTETDLKSGGAAYEMVWGRNHTQQLADT